MISDDCPKHQCCSIYGHCGTDPEFCHDVFTCKSDNDCAENECCSRYGHCGIGQEYCGGGSTASPMSTTTEEPNICASDIDCNQGKGECCSLFGHCGVGQEFCWKPTAQPTTAGTTSSIPETTSANTCRFNQDCPPKAPCCSPFGHCGDGPDAAIMTMAIIIFEAMIFFTILLWKAFFVHTALLVMTIIIGCTVIFC